MGKITVTLDKDELEDLVNFTLAWVGEIYDRVGEEGLKDGAYCYTPRVKSALDKLKAAR